MTVKVVITHNRFPEIAAALPRETGQVVRKTAFGVEAEAKNRVPVDTGALKGSIQTRMTPDDLAGEIKAGGSSELGSNVEYAAFVEFGTRKMSAQPYMVPAAEVMAPQFEQAMRQLLARMGK